MNFGKWNRRRFCNGGSFCNPRQHAVASSSSGAAVVESDEIVDVCFKEIYPLRRIETVEGKIFIKLDSGKGEGMRQLTVGCNLPGKWILHWGVNYVEDVGSEWDQPPVEMRPLKSIAIKDYAVETPLKKLASAKKEDPLYELTINVIPNSGISAINFVLKDDETGTWYQHRGRDFKVPLVASTHEGSNVVQDSSGFDIWAGTLGQLSNILQNKEGTDSRNGGSQSVDPNWQVRQLEGFYEEHSIVKESFTDNSLIVSVRKCPETFKQLLQLETDLTGNVVVHWGVCRDGSRNWELPVGPYPSNTTEFKKKALRTLLQVNKN